MGRTPSFVEKRNTSFNLSVELYNEIMQEVGQSKIKKLENFVQRLKKQASIRHTKVTSAELQAKANAHLDRLLEYSKEANIIILTEEARTTLNAQIKKLGSDYDTLKWFFKKHIEEELKKPTPNLEALKIRFIKILSDQNERFAYVNGVHAFDLIKEDLDLEQKEFELSDAHDPETDEPEETYED